jgi:DNA-binding transcriptional LysR family regulator
MADLKQSDSMPLLDIELVRTFVVIAETGSFTNAAKQLCKTPAALSQQIKRLESTLEQTLLLREAKQTRLTPQGTKLMSYGRRMLKLNRDTMAEFLVPSLQGSVRFGVPEDIGTRILPNVLAQFAHAFPGVQVNVDVNRSSELMSRLKLGKLDIAMVTAIKDSEWSHAGIVLTDEALVWAASESGVAAQTQPLPLSVAEPGCAWRSLALEALEHDNIDYRVAYSCDNSVGQSAAINADLAVGPLPKSLVKPPLIVQEDLPEIGDYQLVLMSAPSACDSAQVLAECVQRFFLE